MKDFIPYETGIPEKLKIKGFDESCLGFYFEGEFELNTKGKTSIIKPKKFNSIFSREPISFQEKMVSVPTYNQVKDWFRDKHHIKIDVCHAESNGTYRFTLWRWNFDNNVDKWERIGFIGSYEDWYVAANKAIEEALKLI